MNIEGYKHGRIANGEWDVPPANPNENRIFTDEIRDIARRCFGAPDL